MSSATLVVDDRQRARHDAQVDVIGSSARDSVAQRRRQQLGAQVRRADSVGLVDHGIAAAVEALQRQRKGEGQQEREDARGWKSGWR